MTDEAVWKRRFLLFTLVRLCGVAIVALGLAVAFTGIVQAGGTRIPGALLIVVGTVVMAFGPILLRRNWTDEA